MGTADGYAEAVAAAVRAAIEEAKTNTFQVATATGIARSTLERRLLGVTPFTVRELKAIADHLGIPSASLMPSEDEAAVA